MEDWNADELSVTERRFIVDACYDHVMGVIGLLPLTGRPFELQTTETLYSLATMLELQMKELGSHGLLA